MLAEESYHLSQKIFKKLLQRDTAPLAVLIGAAIVGTLVGFIGVGFFRLVDIIQTWRIANLVPVDPYDWVTYAKAFGISAFLAAIGYWLVKKIAPEAGGSGIPEIEGALAELRPVRWWRVIPVKFLGGLGTLGAGMVLGREGPTVQLGGNIGCMIFDLLGLKSKEARHSLLATGAAAGLTAAFNAPLAGILFIIEEMREQFQYNLISVKAVSIGAITAAIVFSFVDGGHSIIDVGQLSDAPLKTLWLYLILGMIFGIVGVVFNYLVLNMQDFFIRFYKNRIRRAVITGALLSGCCGVIALFFPAGVGGGNLLIPQVALGSFPVKMLFFIFLFRMLTTVLCFSSGAPGGIFAPMLALGTVLGTAFGIAMSNCFPLYHLQPATFAIAGMGALFAASVRAPLTGIVLVLEMTNNYQLILPMIITCLGATLLAQFLGGNPLYSSILTKTLERQNVS
ncbi:H(+)/Cl(-) exchange transporter ClcA [Commensalibacter intestini]|uniref:H(+)/Cl(-) exchange transporter ClcA n=1 Tax=Commensalibacter intestini TaxID=479936 RepID=A0A251ZXD5_9PROT|nr:H(+)/Cl(-) exchange transporter ClcA [Commensalibacter intestini]OUI79334.1 H(+)/Cl(-) exchange transporter ClcA [Commensalibacter intestini]